jgi:hypothetical protein
MSPHDRYPLPHCTSTEQLGIPRVHWVPIYLAFANGQIHRTMMCRHVPSASAGWPPEFDAGAQSPCCGRVGPIGLGGTRELPVTSCPTFLDRGKSLRARITHVLENRSPTSRAVVRFAGGERTRFDFPRCCPTARAPPFHRQKRHPFHWGARRVSITSSAPS